MADDSISPAAVDSDADRLGKGGCSAGPYRIFTEGDILYALMIDDVLKASHQVILEAYIFREDEIGRAFIDALCTCAGRGISVTLRVDAFGSLGGLSNEAIVRMRRCGVDLRWSCAWRWRRPLQYHRRNHCKLLVVAGRAVYLGGFDICDDNSLAAVGERRWRDTHARLPPSYVDQAVTIFWQR